MVSIQQLSQEVGIGVDTLRIWERRYGFPLPQRNRRGHRCYPQEQVEALRMVSGLQRLGFRPGRIFSLNLEERRALLNDQHKKSAFQDRFNRHLLCAASPAEIKVFLRTRLDVLGAKAFILECVRPLVQSLDCAWTAGSISIGREHLLSDCLLDVLGEQLQLDEKTQTGRRILLATLSGERHKLGLFMAGVLFSHAGLFCTLLREEIPLSEIVQLVADLQSDAVALSFSAFYSTKQAKKELAALRHLLPSAIPIIAGGQALQRGFTLPGVNICSELEKVSELSKRLLAPNNREFPATVPDVERSTG